MTVIIALMLMLPAQAEKAPAAYEINGTFSTYVDWRQANKSASVRQDWNVENLLDAQIVRLDRRGWSFDFSGRLYSDLDGRRPAAEPGIYNGIQETIRDNIQPDLYRAVINWQPEAEPFSRPLDRARIGRQYNQDGDFLWYDGLTLGGQVPLDLPELGDPRWGLFGGIPVRLFESASDDWLVGGNLDFSVYRARIGVQAYHVEDKDRYGVKRRDDVGRVSLNTPIGDRMDFSGMVRLVGRQGYDARANLNLTLPQNMQLRLNYRMQSQDRDTNSTEIDAYTVVLGRSIGAFRNRYEEFGADLLMPMTEHLALDVGGMTRATGRGNDRNNLDYQRYFVSAILSDLTVAGHRVDLTATGEAYDTDRDYQNTFSGSADIELSPKVTLGLGTTYALYSYDYLTGTVKQNVRVGTVRLTAKPAQPLTIEARYDLEDDDYRAHHFGRLGFRYDF